MERLEWKWSHGEKMEKTPRPQNNSRNIPQQSCEYSSSGQNYDTQTYQQSLLSENDIWSIDGPIMIDKPLNKREDNYNKMSEREMFGQINQNPFLVRNNYIDDVMIQDRFLKPICTTSEKEKKVSFSDDA